MYLQALLIRAGVAAATGLLLTAAMLIERTGHAALAAAPSATVAQSTRRAAPAPVMLPTIHVRPAVTDLAAASAPRNEPATLAIEAAMPDGSASTVSTSLRGPDIDMPYYSFGKVLPRIGSKE